VPAVSGTPVEIPTDAGSDLVFPGQGITVHVVGAAPAAGQLLHGERVAYGSALTDTDLLITPQDVGAEYSWQARSSDSPQDLRLAFGLPAGMKLVRSANAVTFVQAGNVIGAVQPPQAVDAAGDAVPTKLAVSGNEVIVHASLDGPDVQFPVYVDPLVAIQDSYRLNIDGSGHETGSGDPFNGWTYYSNDVSQKISHAKGVTNGTDAGMSLLSATGTIPDGAWGEYVYQAPANTFIQRADFGYMSFAPANNAAGSPSNTRSCMFEGIYSTSKGWWENGNYSAEENGDPNQVQYGPNNSPGVGPMGDCGTSSSAPRMPSGTFRAFCVGTYNGPLSWNYDGTFYNAAPWGNTAANTATSPTPTQLAHCDAAWPNPRSDQGSLQNMAAWGMQFYNTANRTSNAFQVIYGADIYLGSDVLPTLDAAQWSGLPAPATWVDATSGSVTCDPTVSGAACPSGGGPVARDAGLGIWAESLYPPTGTNIWDPAPAQKIPNTNTTPSGTCTGAPYHSPCPAIWSSPKFSYTTNAWPEGADTVELAAFNIEQQAATVFKTIHVDHQAPQSPTFSGPLWDDRYDTANNPNGSSPSNPMPGLSYSMQINGIDPGNGSGPAEFDVQVDGNAAQALATPCSQISASDTATQCGNITNGNRTATVSYNFQSLDYAVGEHTICVTLKDQFAQEQGQAVPNCQQAAGSTACQAASNLPAHVSQTCFQVYTKPLVSLGNSQSANQNDQLGLESFYDYRKLATGAGSYARVNLANGNMVWDDVPVVDPGQGLSTFVEVAYNSQHRLGELAPLQNQSLLPFGEYNQIGQGFSLGIDGLTRLNEPLDLSLQALGRISFTDVDGTRHTFIQDPGNSQHWIRPPGVFLWLRQWSSTDPSKTWAITRPDGVTFFFDQAGFETQIEDRQTNTIKFDSRSVLLGTLSAGTSGCPAQLPLLGAGCIEQVTDVTDQNGQKMYVCYYEASGDPTQSGSCPTEPALALTDPSRMKIADIVDHAGHVLHFDYDSSGNLKQMTVSAESTDPTAKRVFKFGWGGANDSSPPLSALLTQLGLPSVSNLIIPPGLTSITDPNGNATNIKYASAQLLDASDPCPRDDLSNPLPPQLGGLVGLEPKCVARLTDRGGGETDFTYATAKDASGNETHTATV
jgi:hypothetical protein